MPRDVVYDAVLGSLTLRQVVSGSFSGGGQVIAGTASGAVDPSEYFGGTADPRARFTSMDIAAILGVSNICTAGVAVSSGTITIPFQRGVNQSTFAGSTAHFTVSGSNGLTIPLTFSASQDEEGATCELETVFRSTDGLTNPASTNVNQSLAATSFNAMFGLGPVAVNGSQVPYIVGFTVNTGISLLTERHDGGNYPDTIFIQSRRPSIDLMFNDFDALNSFSSTFAVMTSANCFLRKRSGVGFVSEATTSHCRFTFADGITSTEQISATGTSTGRAMLRLYGEALTVSAAAAISV